MTGVAVRNEPEKVTRVTAKPVADEPEIAVIAKPLQLGSSLIEAGRLVIGAPEIWRLRSAGAELRDATAAELQQHHANVGRSEFLAPKHPPAPPKPPIELWPVPTSDEARAQLRADPDRLHRATMALELAARDVVKAGGPAAAVRNTLVSYRNQMQRVGKVVALKIAIQARNHFVKWAARGDLQAQRYFEEQHVGVNVEPASFDPRPFLRLLASRGISLSARGDQLVVHPAGGLNTVDRGIIATHRKAIVDMLSTSEIL